MMSSLNPIRWLNECDKLFDYVVQLPWFLKIITIMVILVMPIPISFLIAPEMYTNKPHSSLFFKEYFILNNLLLIFHIAAAAPATLFGPFLFSAKLRQKYTKAHRSLGKIYVVGCLISAVTVLPLALSNGAGIVAHIGFGNMAVIWFIVTYFAYTSAIKKDFVSHRRWMLRSYAMTFAFVHVNLTYKFTLPYEHMSVEGIKAMQSMVSWLANLLLMELYMEATNVGGKWLGFKKFFKRTIKWSKEDKFYLSLKTS